MRYYMYCWLTACAMSIIKARTADFFQCLSIICILGLGGPHMWSKPFAYTSQSLQLRVRTAYLKRFWCCVWLMASTSCMPPRRSNTIAPTLDPRFSCRAVGRISVNFVKSATFARLSSSVSGTTLIKLTTCTSKYCCSQSWHPWNPLSLPESGSNLNLKETVTWLCLLCLAESYEKGRGRHTSFSAVGLIKESGKRQNNALIGSHFWIACLCIFPLAAKRAFKRLSRAKRDSSKAIWEFIGPSKSSSSSSSILACAATETFEEDSVGDFVHKALKIDEEAQKSALLGSAQFK